jgi:hypothetical protein
VNVTFNIPVCMDLDSSLVHCSEHETHGVTQKMQKTWADTEVEIQGLTQKMKYMDCHRR